MVAHLLGQACLGQADIRPQRQHHLAERIVALTVGVSFHRRSPFRMTLQIKAV